MARALFPTTDYWNQEAAGGGDAVCGLGRIFMPVPTALVSGRMRRMYER